MDTHDLMNETTILPELSFEDLLDIGPSKNTESNSDTAEFEHDETKIVEDTLNTPGPKAKIKVTTTANSKTENTAPLDNRLRIGTTTSDATTSASGDEQSMENKLKVMPVIKDLPSISETTPKPQFMLSNKNIGSAVEIPAGATVKPLIKIAPKIVTTTAKPTVVPATKIEINKSNFSTIGKTMVKTANGQIFYIPKSVAGTLPVVRLQTKSAAAVAATAQTSVASTLSTISSTITQSTTTAASLVAKPIITTTTSVAATPNTNKTLTIQVVRSADGKLMPLKAIATTTIASTNASSMQSITSTKLTAAVTTATSTTTTTTATKIAFASQQIVGSKNILTTPSGQLIIKAPAKSIAATAATTSIATTTLLGKVTPIVTGQFKPITTTLATAKSLAETNTTTTAASSALKTFQIKRLGSTPILTTATTTTAAATSGANTLIKTVPNVAVQINPVAISSKSATETAAVKTFKIHRLTGSQILTSTTTTTTTNATNTVATCLTKPTTFVKLPTSTATATTTSPISNKIVVQSVGGKQIVVSNQHIVKLVTKPATVTAASTTTTTTTSAKAASVGKLQAIKIPGQPGVQYVRLLSAPKLATAKATTTANKPITVSPTLPTTTASVVKTLVVCRALTTTTSTVTTTTTATTSAAAASASASSSSISNVKFLNTLPQKVTFVRPLTNSKILVAKSNKEEVGQATISVSNMHAKVQRKIVAVPASGASLLSKTRTTSTAISTTTTVTARNNTMLAKKRTSSDNNKELLDEDETPAKKYAADQRLVMPSRNGVQQQKSYLLASDKSDYVNPKLPLKLKLNSGKIGGGSFKAPQLFDSTLSKVKVKAPYEEKVIRRVVSKPVKSKLAKPKQENLDIKEIAPIIDASSSTVLVRRKHCNCSKSQCLKLYCDCFANGEFCQDCTCRDCFNNLDHEDERQRAIQISLERNPNAFKPKITTADQGDTSMRHNKGCNCKRSGCLKNYCECYEAKIMCSANCKCVGCQNCEDPNFMEYEVVDPKILATLQVNADKATNAASVNSAQSRGFKRSNVDHTRNDDKEVAVKREIEDLVGNDLESKNLNTSAEKQSVNFITDEVMAATVQCVISQAEQCERVGLALQQIEKLVLEEMGRCLVEIIDFSIRNTDQSFTQD